MDNTTSNLNKAIQYVRENKKWSDVEEVYAIEQVEENEEPLALSFPFISNSIYDLMEEWTKQNDLEPEWWMNTMDEEEIFLSL